MIVQVLGYRRTGVMCGFNRGEAPHTDERSIEINELDFSAVVVAIGVGTEVY